MLIESLTDSNKNFCCLPSFHEDEIDGGYKTEKGGQMVPVQTLALKQAVGNDGKDNQRDAFLYHFQLHQCKRSSVSIKANPIGRHLTAIFKKGYAPRKHNDP